MAEPQKQGDYRRFRQGPESGATRVQRPDGTAVPPTSTPPLTLTRAAVDLDPGRRRDPRRRPWPWSWCVRRAVHAADWCPWPWSWRGPPGRWPCGVLAKPRAVVHPWAVDLCRGCGCCGHGHGPGGCCCCWPWPGPWPCRCCCCVVGGPCRRSKPPRPRPFISRYHRETCLRPYEFCVGKIWTHVRQPI